MSLAASCMSLQVWSIDTHAQGLRNWKFDFMQWGDCSLGQQPRSSSTLGMVELVADVVRMTKRDAKMRLTRQLF
jgi:hypothetical protein